MTQNKKDSGGKRIETGSQQSSGPSRSYEMSSVALIAAVGAEARAQRSRRGVTRNNLARHAGISDRYLTELEAGRANVSLSVLHRVATALGLDIVDLLPSPPNADDPLTQRLTRLDPARRQLVISALDRALAETAPLGRSGIALVGLRGAGKSTIGRHIAEKHSLEFVRLRDVIEKLAGHDLSELVSLAGQRAYRRLEYDALKKAVSTNHPVVLEVGGSLVTERQSYDLLLSNYYTVWLRAEPDDHLQRVVDQGDRRPVVASRNALADIQTMLKERENDYRRAHAVVETHGRTVQQCINEFDPMIENVLAPANAGSKS